MTIGAPMKIPRARRTRGQPFPIPAPRSRGNALRQFLTPFLCLVAATAPAQQVTNPIPQPIVKGSLRVQIDPLVQMPSTINTWGSKGDHTQSAVARINFLRESPAGRLWVNDLRGQLYGLHG